MVACETREDPLVIADQNAQADAAVPAHSVRSSGVEGPLVTRPPTVTVLASPAGIISCHGWAVMRRAVHAVSWITERGLCGAAALLELGVRYQGRLLLFPVQQVREAMNSTA
jgi:hypothetical protein